MSMTGTDPITATGAAFSDSATAPMTDAQSYSAAMAAYNTNPQLQQYVSQEYGVDSWMMQIPELQQILVATAMYGWDQAHVDSALDSTQWWKQNGQQAAEWQQLQATDPAEASQQLSQTKATVTAAAHALGVQLTDADEGYIANFATEFSWNSDMINQVISAQYSKTTTNPTSGTAASFQDQATSMIQQYAVPVSSQAMATWTANAVSGTADISGFEDYLRQQAKVLYPFMSTALDNGVTPQSFLAPYTSAATTLLGVSDGSINWSDPKWLSAVTQSGPGGESTPVSLTQFQNTLRTDPTFGWSKTANAVSTAYTTAKQIASTFGKVAG